MKFHPFPQHFLYIQYFNYQKLDFQKENISNDNQDLKKILQYISSFKTKTKPIPFKWKQISLSHLHFFIPSCTLTSVCRISSWSEQWSTYMLIYKWNTLSYCSQFVLMFSSWISTFLWQVKRNFASVICSHQNPPNHNLVSKNKSKPTIEKIFSPNFFLRLFVIWYSLKAVTATGCKQFIK